MLIGFSFHPLAFGNPMMLKEKAVPGIAFARINNGSRTSQMSET
jgi:hypothetical protein